MQRRKSGAERGWDGENIKYERARKHQQLVDKKILEKSDREKLTEKAPMNKSKEMKDCGRKIYDAKAFQADGKACTR